MSMRLVSAGGTYNVRASEMSSHLQDRQPKMVTCIVHFLDDSQQDFEVDVSTIQLSIYQYLKVLHIHSFGISTLLTLLKAKGF